MIYHELFCDKTMESINMSADLLKHKWAIFTTINLNLSGSHVYVCVSNRNSDPSNYIKNFLALMYIQFQKKIFYNRETNAALNY